MKLRILSALIYASTTVALAGFFDGLYGGEPITRHVSLVHTATFGAFLLAIASLVSLFNLRFGLVCGLAGTTLSLPYFAMLAVAFPWSGLLSILRYARYGDIFASILALTISSAYSGWQSRTLLR